MLGIVYSVWVHLLWIVSCGSPPEVGGGIPWLTMASTPRPGRPISWTATPTDSGQVAFVVDRVGTFTVGFDHASYPRRDDDERLHVAYGDWDGQGHCYPNRALPHAPVVNTITLVGGSFFDPQEALAFLGQDSRSWVGWLRAARLADRWTIDVPDRTRARTGLIVACLTEEFLERPDYAELLHAHRIHHAHDRASTHRENLARVDREVDEWVQRRDHERRMLDAQELLIDGGGARQTLIVPPTWRDYQSAATREGQAFLIATVGSRKAG